MSTRAQIRVGIGAMGGSPADLTISDIAGRRVTRIVLGDLSSGDRIVEWDGHTTSGTHVPPGLYFATLRVAASSVTTRIVRVAPFNQ